MIGPNARLMDQTTIIIVLAVHLVCSGALFWLIGRAMPPHSGVNRWALGAVLFGLAYAGRLLAGPTPTWPAMLLLDGAMALASLLFLTGLRQFVALPAGRWPLVAIFLLGFAAAHALAVWSLAAAGRHMLLNLLLSVLYGTLAAEALRARPRQARALRPPLLMLVLMMGSLALLTLLRGLAFPLVGTGPLHHGLFGQLYYGYASLASVMLGLNLVWLVFARLNTQLAELASHDALTRLLNRNGLDDVVRRHFAARESRPVTLLQIDIDHFKAFNDYYGYARGDQAIQMLARILTESVVRYGSPDSFVGHIGGDDFVVLTSPETAEVLGEQILEWFNNSSRELYDQEDRERGHVEVLNRRHAIERFPLMSLTIALVSTDRVPVTHLAELIDIAQELKAHGKGISGSVLVGERRRRDGADPDRSVA